MKVIKLLKRPAHYLNFYVHYYSKLAIYYLIVQNKQTTVFQSFLPSSWSVWSLIRAKNTTSGFVYSHPILNVRNLRILLFQHLTLRVDSPHLTSEFYRSHSTVRIGPPHLNLTSAFHLDRSHSIVSILKHLIVTAIFLYTYEIDDH